MGLLPIEQTLETTKCQDCTMGKFVLSKRELNTGEKVRQLNNIFTIHPCYKRFYKQYWSQAINITKLRKPVFAEM